MFAPLIINIGKVKYYSNVHMFTALFIIVLEYISVKTIHTPVAVILISTICQIGKIMALLYCVSKYFDVNMIKLFPINILIKVFSVSSIILLIEYYFIKKVGYPPFIEFLLSFVIFIVLYMIIVRFFNINYSFIIKPLFSRK